ncbi:MAG TPA: hydantoinase B/oxoprolinase family protein [Candidatus Dormibacteraeota bacterium]|nr:hydantoinase B/oxoprolinase family protein [Candidatus Dormibacteraeota bacterium]
MLGEAVACGVLGIIELVYGPAVSVDPIVLQVVEGTLASVEAEVEAAIERTARSPMIRDQHDYRAGIHDRRCRKLTGRSYSAMVQPVVRDFPPDAMREGDVFYHNDVYLSEGSVGHLPDLTTTVPVFHDGRVVAFVQAFGHHDDIGGMVPGSMPAHATSAYQEGLMVPPVRLFSGGVRNEDLYRVIVRNSRTPESFAGDLDSEVAACQMGARRLAGLFARYGVDTVEACFDALVRRCADRFRREILPCIPDGTYTFEDYIEHDGVEPPRLHVLRMTMTKTPDRIVCDLTGTGPQARGPINHAGDYADGLFLRKWMACILRNLASSPERAAELDINEGVCDVLELRFPPRGTLVTPEFPAPTNARSFLILRLLGVFAGCLAQAVGGRMPADQETIRYWGVHGHDADGRWYLLREVLGGGSGGRFYADGSDAIHIVPDSKNLPAEFAETRFPVLIERLALAVDSGGPGRRRGGLGYDKHIRLLRDASFVSTADRARLGCYGVAGGMAGLPYEASVDGSPLPGMNDDVPLPAGTLLRLRTTGGGGWGDPFEREPEQVLLDVRRGLVSVEAAERDYGVVIRDDRVVELRRPPRSRPFIDRGPGFDEMASTLR